MKMRLKELSGRKHGMCRDHSASEALQFGVNRI